MWTYGQGDRFAVVSIFVSVLACGGDSKVPTDASEEMDPSKPGPARCSDTNFSLDGGAAAIGQSQGQVHTGTTDGLGLVLDSDAGDAGLDAARADGDPNHCDVIDPRYGCGTALNSNWLRFKSGLEIDRRYERGWTPVFEVGTRVDLVARCAAFSLPGIAAGQFKVPAVEDVRTMAGGCENTVLGSSGCAVRSGTFPLADAGLCGCDDVCVGPNQGKFCLPDVPECLTLWTETICEGTPHCLTRQVWIYNVTTGAVELTPESLNSPLLMGAKGRCFAGIPYPIP